MAFDSLTEKLQNVFKNLRSKGRLTEDDVKEAMKEVKRALLEADVNFKVVKSFIKAVSSIIAFMPVSPPFPCIPTVICRIFVAPSAPKIVLLFILYLAFFLKPS